MLFQCLIDNHIRQGQLDEIFPGAAVGCPGAENPGSMFMRLVAKGADNNHMSLVKVDTWGGLHYTIARDICLGTAAA